MLNVQRFLAHLTSSRGWKVGGCSTWVASNPLREVTVDIDPVNRDALLTPAQVAAMLYVDPKTVTRWAKAGKVGSIRTPGGHRRFLRSEIVAMVAEGHVRQHDASSLSSLLTAPQVVAPDLVAMVQHLSSHGTESEHAAVVVADAVAIALEAQAAEAAHNVTLVAKAVAAAAQTAAEAAETAREARSAAAEFAAASLASRAARTAAAMQLRADAAAEQQSEAASRAASVVAAATRPDHDREIALTALRLAAVVQAAAVATARDRASAATSVADAVTAAAADVAFTVSAAALAFETEVAKVAAALQATATATARQVATDTDARASGAALVAREAAAAVKALEVGLGREPDTPLDSADRIPHLDQGIYFLRASAARVRGRRW
jgi:excisionase family DNA binding protein